MSELRLMVETLVVSHSEAGAPGDVGWKALEVAQWMTELATTELTGHLSDKDVRKVQALSQVIATVSEALENTIDHSQK